MLYLLSVNASHNPVSPWRRAVTEADSQPIKEELPASNSTVSIWNRALYYHGLHTGLRADRLSGLLLWLFLSSTPVNPLRPEGGSAIPAYRGIVKIGDLSSGMH